MQLKRVLAVLLLLAVATLLGAAIAETADAGETVAAEETALETSEETPEEVSEYHSFAENTFLALLPPIIAIVLALITKEVYSSLFIGILAGALLYANFNPELAFQTIIGSYNDGGMITMLTSSWNVGILMFLVVLGIIVVLINRAGGSTAYGEWAAQRIGSRQGAGLAAFGLGALIFVDDYFNCLTVGNVMRPVTDKQRISRAKLAYIIDSTAAPICIIAPISSWAAAVSGVVDGMNGFTLFIRSIPYNFYALLTIVMVIALCVMKLDYGPMAKHERNAVEKGDLFTTPARPFAHSDADAPVSKNGKVIDLILPVLILIACCVLGMIYTGGFFEGNSFVNSFAECDASVGLAMGSFLSLILIVLFYLFRKVLTFHQCMDAIPEGFRQMVPAIMILLLAWTLSGMTTMLGAKYYVADLLQGSAKNLAAFLPAIVFLVSVALAFATGTSWGTFGILLPIVVGVLKPDAATPVTELLIITVSACLAGAVCGDHCSPISDTTIMASTGAQCEHINHVSTQLPYAMTVAAVSFVMYILTGFVRNWLICLPIGIVLMLGVLFAIKLLRGKNAN